MPVSSHQDTCIERSGNVKLRRQKLVNCLTCSSAGILIVCGLAVAGAEFIFHAMNRSLGGCALATGLLLVGEAIVAMATRGRHPTVNMACKFAVPLLCLASVSACIATALLAFTAANSSGSQPWCDLIRLPQSGNSTQQLNSTSSAAAAASAVAAAPSRLPEDAIQKKSGADSYIQANAIFWTRLVLILLLCASVSLSVLLMSISLTSICRIVKASRRRHIRPSSLRSRGGGDPIVGGVFAHASSTSLKAAVVSCDSTTLGLLP